MYADFARSVLGDEWYDIFKKNVMQVSQTLMESRSHESDKPAIPVTRELIQQVVEIGKLTKKIIDKIE